MTDIHKEHHNKRHEPLAFLSGHYNNTKLRWSTMEKEAFSIMATIERMHWIASCPEGFDLFTDHNNLIFIFNPLTLVSDLSQSSIKKLIRWAVLLSYYNYICIHISGNENVWADLLSRWISTPTISRLIHIPPLPSTNASEFEWPNIISIRQSQDANDKANNLILKNELWHTSTNHIWIPPQDANLQLRL